MQPATVIVFPPFRLDRANERLWCGEQPIHLRPKTFTVLQCLLEHPGQLLTKITLLNTVWPETVVSEAVLLGCIRDLRRALCDDSRRPQFIETVHRRGYRFMISHLHLGEACNALGELVPGRTHLEQSLALFDPQQPRFVTSGKATRHAVLYRLTLAKTLWMLGYPEQAMERIREATTIAQDLSHPFSLLGAFATAATLHQYRRAARLTQEYADVTLALVHEHGFTQYAAESAIYQGWGMARQDQPEEGMRVIIQGLDAFRKTGVQKDLPHFLAMLVDVYGIVGQVQEGLTVLAEALDLVEQTGERRYESELYCVKGEFLLRLSRDNPAEAEACFQHALDVARRQQAKSWELRAATSLARLWQSQGKRQAAYDLLAPVYAWFPEGFDTPDLKDAKALLQETAG